MFESQEDLSRFIRDEGVQFVDVRFSDLFGVIQHFAVPVSHFDDSV